MALCLADDDLDATASRLDLTVEAGSRTRPDGEVVSWRGAGIEDPSRSSTCRSSSSGDGPPALHPGATPVEHESGPGSRGPRSPATRRGSGSGRVGPTFR